MAITSFELVQRGRSGEYAAGSKKLFKRYVVKTSTSDEDEENIRARNECPEIGEKYDNNGDDQDALCTSVTIQCRNETGNVWDVEAVFETDVFGQIAGGPSQIDWTMTPLREALQEDIDGNAIANSAGDPFVPSVERDRYLVTVKITKTLEADGVGFDIANVLSTYPDTVNSATYFIDGVQFPRGTALMKEITAVKVPYTQDSGWAGLGNNFYRVTFTIIRRLNDDNWPHQSYGPTGYTGANGWLTRILDAGLRYKPTPSDELRPVPAGGGTETKDPVPLDGAGGLGDFTAPVWLGFRIYGEEDHRLALGADAT